MTIPQPSFWAQFKEQQQQDDISILDSLYETLGLFDTPDNEPDEVGPEHLAWTDEEGNKLLVNMDGGIVTHGTFKPNFNQITGIQEYLRYLFAE